VSACPFRPSGVEWINSGKWGRGKEITIKLKRGTFTAIFFLACIAALELEQVVLAEI
jgi:Domain of unknown function (DUF6471)